MHGTARSLPGGARGAPSNRTPSPRPRAPRRGVAIACLAALLVSLAVPGPGADEAPPHPAYSPQLEAALRAYAFARKTGVPFKASQQAARVRAMAERELGRDNPAMLAIWDAVRFDDADAERVFAMRLEVYGPGHPETARSLDYRARPLHYDNTCDAFHRVPYTVETAPNVDASKFSEIPIPPRPLTDQEAPNCTKAEDLTREQVPRVPRLPEGGRHDRGHSRRTRFFERSAPRRRRGREKPGPEQ